MKKFVNHIDHVTWISSLDKLEENVSTLEKLADAKLTRFERHDMGFIMYLSWEAGLEVVAPMAQPTDFNQALKDHLDAHGEGILGVVYGVKNLEAHKTRLEALGFEVGPEMDDLPTSPWSHKLNLKERMGGVVMNSWFVLGDIDYADQVVTFVDAEPGTT